MVGAVEAADAALKSANVTLLGYELNRAGDVTVKFSGDVAAVQAAVSTGAAAAKQVGLLLAAHTMPRPDDQVAAVSILSRDNLPRPDRDKETRPQPLENQAGAGPSHGESAPAGGKPTAKPKPAPRKKAAPKKPKS